MFVLKNRYDPELSAKRTSMQGSAVQNIFSKYSPTWWCQQHFVHWRKGIYSDHT